MRGAKVLMALLAAGALTMGAGVALAATDASKTTASPEATTVQTANKAEVHRVRGEVTAVEPGAKSMVVKAMEGKKALDVGVDVTDKTIIRQGKANKTLDDIKVGDRVWMKYDRTNDKLVADQIRILKSAPVAAKSESSKKSY
ncbi:MAG: hypothetical protein ABSD47_04460 [Candidatus Methylomirabilota bacterium]|jgi:Cu/Ag efflux protein CusF